MDKLKEGYFISFEGIEGSGKTTISRLIAEMLMTDGYEVLATYEPGGTLIGNKIRDILLMPEHKNMSHYTELLLYNAARAQHLYEKILPALRTGKLIISDRFIDSTIAYQGYGRGIDLSLISIMDKIVTGGLKPNLTILLDVEVELGLKRNRGINKIDRLEIEEIEFHKRVREGYHLIAANEPERFKVVDASMSIEEVLQIVSEIIKKHLPC
ncbi:MAG: dTMP kinase [Thermodesulfovibrionales bacterium]|nr:dTMP kinase [Thermodesulfovibrionales bacterium]